MIYGVGTSAAISVWLIDGAIIVALQLRHVPWRTRLTNRWPVLTLAISVPSGPLTLSR
jgi:hypothetical protein